MVVSNALKTSVQSKAEVKAEDTDILWLLVHHFGEQNNEIIMTTRNKFHAITEIANFLDSSQKDILLFIHNFFPAVIQPGVFMALGKKLY